MGRSATGSRLGFWASDCPKTVRIANLKIIKDRCVEIVGFDVIGDEVEDSNAIAVVEDVDQEAFKVEDEGGDLVIDDGQLESSKFPMRTNKKKLMQCNELVWTRESSHLQCVFMYLP